MCQFSVRNWDILMNKWRSTLTSVLIGSSSDSSPPLIGAGGGLVCESVRKADMLSGYFDGKQSRDPVDLPLVMQKKRFFFAPFFFVKKDLCFSFSFFLNRYVY